MKYTKNKANLKGTPERVISERLLSKICDIQLKPGIQRYAAMNECATQKTSLIWVKYNPDKSNPDKSYLHTE